MVSNFGNIKSLKTNKLLNCKNLRSGYKSVWLCDKSYKIHRLVASAFLHDDNSEKNIVNHIDGNKLNNNLNNLEWVTLKENTKHAYDIGLNHTTMRRVSQFDNDGNLVKIYESLKEARISTGIDDAAISKVCKNTRRTAGGYVWKFTDVNQNEIHMNTDTYVQVKDFPSYKINNDGTIYSTKFSKILKQQTNPDGYAVISLANNNVKKTFLVHRLVADHFIKKIDGKDLVNHMDGDRKNNNMENLEWVTNSENIKHAINLKKIRTTK